MPLVQLIAGYLPARRHRRPFFNAPSRSRRRSLAGAEDLEARLTLSVVTLTANEQLLLELINRARANPLAEVNRTPGISDLNQGLEPGTISTAPKQPLAPHQALVNAAGSHSDDMLRNDYFSHYSLNGDSPSDRAMDAGYPVGVAENIAWGGSTGTIDRIQHVIARHQALFVSPGHRVNLMNDNYREVGTGVRYGVFTTGGVNYNASMVTENFGRRSGNAFITGVAYTDAVVDNNFYSVGEGAGGVLITATNVSSGATYSTDTGTSGGYSLQVPDGTYTVTAVGGGISGQVQHLNVSVSGRNVKVDVVTTEGTPVDPPDSQPPPDTTTNGMALLGRSGDVWWLAASTGTNLVNRQAGTWSNRASWVDVQTADVDGDGDDDVVGRANGRWWVARSNGSGFTNESWCLWSTRSQWKDVTVGDFDGDGRDDIAGRASNGGWWIAHSTGSLFINELWTNWSNRINWQDVRVGDTNGDGRDDLIGRAQNGTWWVAQSTGQSFANQRWGNWSSGTNWTDVAVSDLNGDGRADVVGRAGSDWWIAESTGASFTSRIWTRWSTSLGWNDIRVGDFDGDGRDDVSARNGGAWWVSRTVFGNVVNENWGATNPSIDWDDVLILDLDRDGLADIASRNGNNWWVARSNGSQFASSLWGQWPNGGAWEYVLAGDFG
jgi:hypothetical protein